MRKIYLVFLSALMCICTADAAVRTQKTISRGTAPATSSRQSENVKTSSAARTTITRKTQTNSSAKNNTDQKRTTSRSAAKKTIVARQSVQPRANAARATLAPRRVARAGSVNITTKSFDDNYNACRESYFTCMDQFCATQNDTYRRCVCSSRLTEIQNKEKLLSQTADNLQDFHDLNIDAISKTSNEVKSMLTASDGETGIKKDTSNASKTLSNISDVLNKSKKKSLATNGTLDIAGNIKSIWATTDLISGSDIANLTGESLYNAVHAQCADIVSQNCRESDLKTIVSAYGMYIENDCSLLASGIDTKMTAANAAIRTTRHNMQDARLENYNTHNSLSVNECITHVRQDMTADSACGKGYVHCLDFSGKYLNSVTGEPIYSADFYQLANQLSISGDVLKNGNNASFVTTLDKKRVFAEQSLNLCSDDADAVWDEFLRQTIVEVYQAQQQRVQNVKTECLQVVNTCYLKQSSDLNEFSDNSSLITLGHTLELSESLCADKLTTCSNLYGGGPEGLSALISTMTGITDQTIAQSCPELLKTFAQNICAVSTNDSGHSYPYGCRTYAPGESMYATQELCNTTLVNPFSRSEILLTKIEDSYNDLYACKNAVKRYTSCEFNYYLYNPNTLDPQTGLCSNTGCFDISTAIECHACPAGYICSGNKASPKAIDQTLYQSCGVYYIGSLYQQLVRYAIQNCTRPSNESYVLPESILADVDTVMKSVQSALKSELSVECSIYDGTWVDIPWQDEDSDGQHDLTGDSLLQEFYSATGTNKLWGYCK